MKRIEQVEGSRGQEGGLAPALTSGQVAFFKSGTIPL